VNHYYCVVTVVIITLRCTTLLYDILLSRHLISRLTDTINWWKLRITIVIHNVSTNWCRIGLDPVYGQWCR